MGSFSGYSYGKPYATWRLDTSGIDLDNLGYRVRKALKTYLEQEAAPSIRQYMQNHHGWQNQTRMAEDGLTVDVNSKGNMRGSDYSLEVAMYHTARHNGYQYGRALEGIDPIHGVHRTDLGVLEETTRLYCPVVVSDMRGILDEYGSIL